MVWRETVAPASEVMNISMDGAMVNIRNEGWKEVKLVISCHLEKAFELSRSVGCDRISWAESL